MTQISVPIPNSAEKQDIEIEVRINGIKQQLHYRVELFYWEDCRYTAIDKAYCIKEHLAKYDPEWRVYYIGAPTKTFVPVTFVRRETQNLLLTFND